MTSEYKLNEVTKILGSCATLLTNKSKFIEYYKPFRISKTLTSAQFQKNLELHFDELGDYLDDNQLSRMTTDIQKCAKNIGTFPEAMWHGETPFDNKLYMQVLDLICSEVKQSYTEGYKHAHKVGSYPITFNLTSSIGFVTMPDELDFNCTYSASKKRRLLDEIKGKSVDELLTQFKDVNILVGYRLQADTKEKRGKRPAYVFGKEYQSDVISTTVENEDGFRVRHVAGFPWVFNKDLMVVNSLIFTGLTSLLTHSWKFTHDDILEKFKGKFVVCTDISNNDINFIPEENDYIHKTAFPSSSYRQWEHVQSNASIWGCYPDSNNRNRYYRQESKRKPLLSGEGLTSIVNKIKHTTMQYYNYCVALYNLDHSSAKSFILSNDELKKICDDRSLYMLNNGDDTIDAFDDKKMRDRFTKIATSNPYAIIGIEPPSFSGIYFSEDKDGRIEYRYANMKSLFVKGIEKERRDMNSSLSSLFYNSLLGKSEFMLKYPDYYGVDVIHSALDLYFRINEFEGDLDELKELAKVELSESEADSRLTAIYKLLDVLGETDPNVLNYKYTADELIQACPECVDELFIQYNLTDIVTSDLLQELNTIITNHNDNLNSENQNENEDEDKGTSHQTGDNSNSNESE
jgi:hypothetical protein